MNETSEQLQTTPEATTLDILRVETALSRYPIHRLANKGTISINIRKVDGKGATSLLWEVTYNSKYGQPGPLAYKLDTLIINQRIEEAGRPAPKVLKLGSLREIASELNLGGTTSAVKTALRQNAFAAITAKITYKAVDKAERTLEADFTRYSIIFTGEKLPDGRKADCVYLVLNDIYAEVLNTATRRPLDYDYLRSLPPGPQRFYEIVSYQMLPAVTFNQRAKLPYSEFCMYSTMTRYETFEQVKKQMYKIHQPHVKAGYLAKVEYEATTDEEGRPDWNMFYTAGERARFQQLVFSFEIPFTRRERAKPTKDEPKKTTKVVEAAQEPLPLVPVQAERRDQAPALVRTFYRLRFGTDREPTAREIEQAMAHLAGGEEWARHLIEYAARYGKEQDGFPENFGGTASLAPKIRSESDAQRQKREAARLKKARQSHQEAHTGAYHAFLGELLAGKLQTALPEAFASFSAQEEKTYRFFKHRAEKADASERSREDAAHFYDQERRVQRFLDFIEKTPRSGIPGFWQWDEKFNPHPFDPAANEKP